VGLGRPADHARDEAASGNRDQGIYFACLFPVKYAKPVCMKAYSQPGLVQTNSV
jgi:hypothetical protein